MKRLVLYTLLSVCSLISGAQTSFVMKYNNDGIDSTATFSKIGFLSDWNGYSVVATDNKSSRQLNIGNIKSISRYDLNLANASSEEAQTILEEKSTLQTEDIQSVINALNKNKAIENAQTEDGNNMIVTFSDGRSIVYPMNILDDPFTDEGSTRLSRIKKGSTGYTWPSKYYNTILKDKNIIVLDYFTNNEGRAGQNNLIETIMDDFNSQGYTVKLFKHEEMTYDGIYNAIRNYYMYWYEAILIFGHGVQKNGKSWLITSEQCDPYYDNNVCYDPERGDYRRLFPLSEIQHLINDGQSIVYLGLCNSNLHGIGGSKDSRPTVFSWEGNTNMAEAHGAILFHRMLKENKSVEDVYNYFHNPMGEGNNNSLGFEMQFAQGGKTSFSLQADISDEEYAEGYKFEYYRSTPSITYFSNAESDHDYAIWKNVPVAIEAKGELSTENHKKVKPFPIYANYQTTSGELHQWPYLFPANEVKGHYSSTDNKGDCYYYNIYMSPHLLAKSAIIEIKPCNKERKLFKVDRPVYVVCTQKGYDLTTNNITITDEDEMSILDMFGAKATEASLDIDETKTFELLTMPGFSYQILMSRNGIVQAEINDDILSIKGLKYGQTTLVIENQEINYQAVLTITVKEPLLKLSTNELKLKVGESKRVDILKGSGSYSVGAPSDIVKCELPNEGDYIILKGIAEGEANVTVNDLKSGEQQRIKVTVTSGGDIVADITSGLVAYYPFAGNANDVTSYGNHGSTTGNVVLATGIEGDANGAYQFGGYDKPGHIRIPNSPQIQFTNEATFSVYIKPTSWVSMDGWGSRINSGGAQCIMAKRHDRYGVTFLMSGNDEGINIWMASMDNQKWAEVSSSGRLKGNYLNKWTHVAIVYGQGYARLYVDGKMIDERESTPNFSRMNAQDLYIGKFSDSWYPFNGLIDEVRIYNRALNATEIEKLSVFSEKND